MLLTPGPKLPWGTPLPFRLPVVVIYRGHHVSSAWWLASELEDGRWAMHLAATTAMYFKARTWKPLRRKAWRFLHVLDYKSFILLSALEHLSGAHGPVIATEGINHLYPEARKMLAQGWESDDVGAIEAYKQLYS